MSGGVDSSLTASLLIEQGYDVSGVYMKNWTEDLPGMICPWYEDYQDAKRVAVSLGIKLEVYDFQTEYKQKVVDYMIQEYSLGRTPNPDIMCNQEVKFKLFLDTAIQNGADMIATGHYAKVVKSKKFVNQVELQMADNLEKDQTYFLYRVEQSALAKSLMPIGDFASKNDVRQAASERNLDTADKKDSQGICFVGKVGIKDFLKQYVVAESGPILDNNGVEIGTHEGAIFYTIGQRHGLNIGGGLPYYVSGKDIAKNIVYVTNNLSDASLWHDKIIVNDVHYINGQPDFDSKYLVRFRYRGPLVGCRLQADNHQLIIKLDNPERAIAAGQSAVIYDGKRVVGGGIIA